MRLVFVTPTIIVDPRGGRALLTRLHFDSLRQLIGAGIRLYQLTGHASPMQRIAGQIDGATPSQAAKLIATIDAHAADTLWLDGGNLGRIARTVRIARPHVRVITFCHNVEARFFFGALRRAPGVRAAAVLIGNYAAERLAMRYSHEVVALSDRDSDGLQRLYGRNADHTLPMALADQGKSMPDQTEPLATDAPLLFVGGAFYANQAGIAWFAEKVAPHISPTTQVVGQGMEVMRNDLQKAANIQVVGAVDRLEPLYRVARMVVAPIFDGSGMKTKVAEALMFGKHVAGTPEAFSGYAKDVVASNALCANADSFVAAITAALAKSSPAFDPVMRMFYERDHSPAALRIRLARILGLSDQATVS